MGERQRQRQVGVAGEKGVQCVRTTDRYKIRTASPSRRRELGGGIEQGEGSRELKSPGFGA